MKRRTLLVIIFLAVIIIVVRFHFHFFLEGKVDICIVSTHPTQDPTPDSVWEVELTALCDNTIALYDNTIALHSMITR